MLERATADLRDLARGLRSARVIAAAAVVTLGAATGLATAMIGLVDRALLSPPAGLVHPSQLYGAAFAVPDRAGSPHRNQPVSGGQPRMTTTSYAAYTTLRDGVPALLGAAAWQTGPSSIILDGNQLAADTVLVSGTYFEVLGARPLLGRAISSADEGARAPVAVLGYDFWTSAFHGNPRAVGRRIAIAGIDYEIAGVMPRGVSGHSPEAVDVWAPIATAMRGRPGWSVDPFRNVVSIVVRIPDGRLAEASAQASAALQRDVAFEGLAGRAIGPAQRRVALWLMAVSLLVLGIGLANAATLLLVRGARRRRETSIRAALGAGRGRLVRHVVFDGLILATCATAVALVGARWLDEAVRRILLPGVIPGTVPGAPAVITAIAAGVLSWGLAVAAGLATLPRTYEPHGVDRRGGIARVPSQSALLVVQTAVSVMLLAGAGMFGRSLSALMGQDFGMRTGDVLIVQFEQGPDDVAGQDHIFGRALDRIRALPFVRMATPIQALPFGPHIVQPVSVPGRDEPPSVGQQLPFLISATPELFDILEIDVIEGRRLTEADDRGAPVVVVNETMARGVWPGERAIGKCIRVGVDPSFDPFTSTGPPMPSESMPCREVVGIARDVRQRSVVPTGNEARLMQYYVPLSQVPGPPGGIAPGPRVLGLLIRLSGDLAVAAPEIRKIVLDGRSDLPYVQVRRYAELLERQVQPWRTGTTLLIVFSALALGVAAIGLYAAFTHAVGQRRREMAVRIAVGASPGRVLRMILGEAARLACVGTVAGTIAAVIAGRTLQALLYGIVPADPAVLGAAAATMLLIAAAATLPCARRAARSDPGTLLRAE